MVVLRIKILVDLYPYGEFIQWLEPNAKCTLGQKMEQEGLKSGLWVGKERNPFAAMCKGIVVQELRHNAMITWTKCRPAFSLVKYKFQPGNTWKSLEKKPDY